MSQDVSANYAVDAKSCQDDSISIRMLFMLLFQAPIPFLLFCVSNASVGDRSQTEGSGKTDTRTGIRNKSG